MRQALTGLVACIVLSGAPAPPQQERVAALKRGVLLYAMPGLPDPNFAQTVLLLLEHNSDGSLGVVLNRPTERSVDNALDVRAGTSGIDLHVSWGGPVQPGAVLSLVRTLRAGPRAQTILGEVHLTPDLDDVRQVLAERGGRQSANLLRLRRVGPRSARGGSPCGELGSGASRRRDRVFDGAVADVGEGARDSPSTVRLSAIG
jgi:hypothetical protein